MGLAATNKACLVFLGRQLKPFRNKGEQFCVFALDCMEHDALDPVVDANIRGSLPFSDPSVISNWNAAFYADTEPSHTEKALLSTFGQWVSNYSGAFARPRAFYVYTYLLPCDRDCKHGLCSDNLFSHVIWAKENCGLEEFHLGWSNNDMDFDIAWATKTAITDLEDEGIKVTLQQVSIAG